MDQDLRKYLEPVVANEAMDERLSKFNVLHHKAAYYSDFLAIRTAQARIQDLEFQVAKLLERISRLEES
jgi:hypothetical protein